MQQHREPVTIRFPLELLSRARQARTERESLNDLVLQAVNREVTRRQALDAHAAIVRINERVKARTGPHSDSVPLIRELREGERRHD